ncbi:MAG: ATP-binding cassette domain-containing protein [Mucispirillum sp.]|nr:ATP-binding cassette domain-containing protein [Mucispirillum sp.]
MIKIDGLCKRFKSGDNTVIALNNINLELFDGDIFGIIGMSGAGKSTLLRCITLLERPDSGSIYIDGSDILSLGDSELRNARRKMGVVFQNYNLLMQKTAAKNVAFPLEITGVPKNIINRRVQELLKLVKMEDKAESYPSQLSGGQRQRVAIARALATNPEALLCDEPTSALDSLTTKQVLNLLKEINKSLNTTIIIITHEISAVKAICNKVAVIDKGEFAETGDTKQIFSNPESEITKMLLGMSEDE